MVRLTGDCRLLTRTINLEKGIVQEKFKKFQTHMSYGAEKRLKYSFNSIILYNMIGNHVGPDLELPAAIPHPH